MNNEKLYPFENTGEIGSKEEATAIGKEMADAVTKKLKLGKFPKLEFNEELKLTPEKLVEWVAKRIHAFNHYNAGELQDWDKCKQAYYREVAEEIKAKAQKHYEPLISKLRGKLDEIEKKLDDREADLIDAKREEREKVLKELEGYSLVKKAIASFTKKKISVRHITIAEIIWQALNKGEK